MECSKCGNPVSEGMQYCNNCGNELGKVEEKVSIEENVESPVAQQTSTPPSYTDKNSIKEWYYIINTEQVGPVSINDMKSIYNSKINRDTYIWKQGFEKWVLLKDTQVMGEMGQYQPISNTTNRQEYRTTNTVGSKMSNTVQNTVGSTNFTPKEIAVYGSAVLAIISTFLPYYTVSLFTFSQSVNLIEGDGKFILVAALVVIVMTFLKKYAIAFGFAVVNVAILVINTFNVAVTLADEIGGLDIGCYLSILATVGCLIATGILFMDNRKLRG